MKVLITVLADVSEEGLEDYLEQWPDFKDEAVGETLAREAVACWQEQDLLTLGGLEPTICWSVLEEVSM